MSWALWTISGLCHSLHRLCRQAVNYSFVCLTLASALRHQHWSRSQNRKTTKSLHEVKQLREEVWLRQWSTRRCQMCLPLLSADLVVMIKR